MRLWSVDQIDESVLPGFQFRVTLGFKNGFGYDYASFSKVTGLEVDHGEMKYRNGNEGKTYRKFPGITEYSPVLCERGYTTNVDAFMSQALIFEPLTGALGTSPLLYRLLYAAVEVLENSTGDLAKRFILLKPYISKWRLGDLDANSDKLLIETIQISHEGIVANPF